MKVSVSLITYNHAPFIAQAIEGVLMQQTNFDFELLIGEDDSPDGTREIVRSYQAKYPNRIRLLLNGRETVVYVNGKPTGQWNFFNNVSHTQGEFVALLDGDDYWTSPHKLQKQVDYLEKNPDCALCFHNVHILDQSNPTHLELHHTEPMREKYGIKDLLKGNFMHTCSVVFRRGLFPAIPSWVYKCPMADWPLHVLNAQHGRIGYLDEVMGVYRKSAQGFWSSQAQTRILSDTLLAAEQIWTCLTPEQKKHLEDGMAIWHRDLVQLNLASGDLKATSRAAADYLKRFPFRSDTHRRYLLKLLLRTNLRRAWRAIAR